MSSSPERRDRQSDVRAATVAESASEERSVRAHWLRRVGVGILVLILLVAVSGVLDRQVSDAVHGRAGETLEVTHPQLLRPGVDVSIVMTVRSASPRVTMVVPQRTFEELGIEDLWPEPDTQTVHGSTVHLGYANPSGEVKIEAAGRLGTAETAGPVSLTIGVLESDLEYDLTMWVLP